MSVASETRLPTLNRGWRVRDQGQALPAMLPGHLSSVMVLPGLVFLRLCSHCSPTKGSCRCRSGVSWGAEGIQSSHFPESEIVMSLPRCLSRYLSEQGLAMASTTGFEAGKGMDTAFLGGGLFSAPRVLWYEGVWHGVSLSVVWLGNEAQSCSQQSPLMRERSAPMKLLAISAFQMGMPWPG